MEDVSPKPREWDRIDRPIFRSDNLISDSVLPGNPRTQPTPNLVVGRNDAPDGRVDRSTTR
jgi:hypothetical protein